MTKKYKFEEEQNKFYEMSNLTPDDTGLPFITWISPKSGKEGHWARIKIEYKGKQYSFSIDDNPEWKMKSHIKNPFNSKEIKLIKQFIKQNKELLLDYWNSEGSMSMKVVFSKLKRI